MGDIDVGNQQNGLNADTSYGALHGTVLVPPGGVLPQGLPLTRNILAGQGGFLSRYAAIPGLGAFANGDQFQMINAQGTQASSTGGSWTVGVNQGQPTQNPWLNSPAGTLNTANLLAPTMLARTGARLVLCSSINGGTAVKVGDFVVKGATVGTPSIYPGLLSIGGATATTGITVGQVIATPIYTQIVAGVGPGSGLVVTTNNSTGFATTIPLVLNPGQANQETVTPTAFTAASPAVSTLTISGTQGAASVVAQITFNIAGYQGSTGLTGPTGTNTTTFTVSIPIPNGTTATNTALLVQQALLATGFCFGAPQSSLGIGAGAFVQNGASAGSPISGPLIYITNSGSGVLVFSAANPGAWANTLLTYTVTVINGTTQTWNTNATGSATAVAFASGVSPTFTATLQNAHAVGEPVIGLANISQNTLVSIPGTAGMINCGMCYVDFTAL
jgi:hypothetical protein